MRRTTPRRCWITLLTLALGSTALHAQPGTSDAGFFGQGSVGRAEARNLLPLEESAPAGVSLPPERLLATFEGVFDYLDGYLIVAGAIGEPAEGVAMLIEATEVLDRGYRAVPSALAGTLVALRKGSDALSNSAAQLAYLQAGMDAAARRLGEFAESDRLALGAASACLLEAATPGPHAGSGSLVTALTRSMERLAGRGVAPESLWQQGLSLQASQARALLARGGAAAEALASCRSYLRGYAVGLAPEVALARIGVAGLHVNAAAEAGRALAGSPEEQLWLLEDHALLVSDTPRGGGHVGQALREAMAPIEGEELADRIARLHAAMSGPYGPF